MLVQEPVTRHLAQPLHAPVGIPLEVIAAQCGLTNGEERVRTCAACGRAQPGGRPGRTRRAQPPPTALPPPPSTLPKRVRSRARGHGDTHAEDVEAGWGCRSTTRTCLVCEVAKRTAEQQLSKTRFLVMLTAPPPVLIAMPAPELA